jgi:hypothetical protein
MLCQACCHGWRTLAPSGTNRAVACAFMQRQRLPHTHVRSCDIGEGLQAEHPLPPTLTVFPATRRLPRPRCQGLRQGQGDPRDQGCPDRAAQGRQACGSQDDTRAERQPLALLLLRD